MCLSREANRIDFGDRPPGQDFGGTTERHAEQMFDLLGR
jgi:hypothetical protein